MSETFCWSSPSRGNRCDGDGDGDGDGDHHSNDREAAVRSSPGKPFLSGQRFATTITVQLESDHLTQMKMKMA